MTTATVAGSTTPTVHSAGSTVRPDTPTAGPDTPTAGPDTPMVHPDTPTVRPATPADIPAICEIYGWEVRNRAATFELVPPDAAEMRARMAGCVGAGFPYLVAEARDDAGRVGVGGVGVAGFAYAAPYRTRAGYRFTVEDSVYVSRDFQRRGIGFALLTALIGECEKLGMRMMVAVVSDPRNGGSSRLHARAGFRLCGTMPGAGWKFGRWIDVETMCRPLGEGTGSAPE